MKTVLNHSVSSIHPKPVSSFCNIMASSSMNIVYFCNKMSFMYYSIPLSFMFYSVSIELEAQKLVDT